MNLETDVTELDTYRYYVVIHCHPQQLQAIQQRYPTGDTQRTGGYLLDVSEWESEERKRLRDDLRESHIPYDFHKVTMSCDD